MSCDFFYRFYKYTQIERKEVVTLIISNLIIFRFFITMLLILGVF